MTDTASGGGGPPPSLASRGPRPSITDVAGVRVGHATDPDGITGCTVVLCEQGATAGAEVRGAAPGTREVDLLHPGGFVQKAHAVLLTGGSAFGLAAADGVVRYLEERGVGFDAEAARVPIVPAAVLFDLGVGSPQARPDAAMGYEACSRATGDPVEEGTIGAGAGATVGKVLGMRGAMKGGVGSWSLRLREGPTVGALVVVNAFGDVVDEQGRIMAGARLPDGGFAGTAGWLLEHRAEAVFGANTTLAVVATDAVLNKAQAWRLAVQGHAGLSRAIVPSHTLFDGDTVFVLATCAQPAPPTDADLVRLGEAAAAAVAKAARRAVRAAHGVPGIPGLADSLR